MTPVQGLLLGLVGLLLWAFVVGVPADVLAAVAYAGMWASGFGLALELLGG